MTSETIKKILANDAAEKAERIRAEKARDELLAWTPQNVERDRTRDQLLARVADLAPGCCEIVNAILTERNAVIWRKFTLDELNAKASEFLNSLRAEAETK